MDILIENGTYQMQNMGDVAMLQVALARILNHWPHACLAVLNEAPDLLQQIYSQAVSVSPRAKHAWQRARFLPLPISFKPVQKAEYVIQNHYPATARQLKTLAVPFFKTDTAKMDTFYAAVERSDAVICCGGGFINDTFPIHAHSLLETFELAQRMHKPAAMFSQGLGPMESPALRSQSSRVFRGLSMLALRDMEGSLELAQSLGVPEDIIRITGDDAVELAYHAAVEQAGSGIGVGLRLDRAAQVNRDLLSLIREALVKTSRRLEAPLYSAPVKISGPFNDLESIQELLGEHLKNQREAERIRNPSHLIAEISRCRVVVTGAYHAAVFALSQGIPVVGLAQSAYYQNKLSGLARQFGPGCEVLRMDDPDLENRLAQSIEAAWERGPALRESLRAAAYKQIEASKTAWEQFLARLG